MLRQRGGLTASPRMRYILITARGPRFLVRRTSPLPAHPNPRRRLMKASFRSWSSVLANRCIHCSAFSSLISGRIVRCGIALLVRHTALGSDVVTE